MRPSVGIPCLVICSILIAGCISAFRFFRPSLKLSSTVVDDDDIGVYGVNASVHDIYGNTQYITIRIFIIREIPPSNIEYLLAVSGLFGAVGAALVVSMGLFVSKVRAGKLE